MPANRTFQVKALSRVEGEGALYVKLDGDRVEYVELNIYEPPRFFEAFLRGREAREVPDITARICGICPVAYQMSACHALEKAMQVSVPPDVTRLRRLLYCAEWIESHALHIHLLHAPDFLGYESGISMAADYREAVERGLRLKKIGNDLLEVLGGRAVHPINVTVGGFYRLPRVAELRELIPDLEWGLQAAIEVCQFTAQLEFPDLQVDYETVSLQHPIEYPMNHGRVVSSCGLEIPVEDYEKHFEERHVAHSTALHSVRLPQQTSYLVGPLSRINNCYDQLSPLARKAADDCGIAWPSKNNFHSIVARAIELVDAYEEALAIVKQYHAVPNESRAEYRPRAGKGCHATEAPRGLIYHHYETDENGLIVSAKIVPPTSQNQYQIEEDLRAYVPRVASLDDTTATRRCEHMIRNYDPCISCATHFLTMKLDR
ncbi:MAG: Ni/Fe hydrogenase subunit alpha [Pirellulaceae bacterium]|nr:Ni/Fe hydrogenase subunit alpha [Planctomycetales bacterium]